MSLSKREQVLLSILLIIGILAGGYYLIFLPMMETLTAAQSRQTELQTEYDTVSAEMKNFDKLQADATALYDAVNERTKKYYPSIIQEQIILTLNQLYTDSAVKVVNESFAFDYAVDVPRQAGAGQGEVVVPTLLAASDSYKAIEAGQPTEPAAPAKEKSEEEQKAYEASLKSVNGLGVTIEFSAPYANVIDLVDRIEKLNRTIQINSINLSLSTDEQTITDAAGNVVVVPQTQPLLTGTIDLVFHAIPKLVDQDGTYVEWTLPPDTGKTDPFQA